MHSARLLRRSGSVARRALSAEAPATSAEAPATSVLPRTIPEEALKFEMRTYIHSGRKLPIPEAHQIGEYKVKLRVAAADLDLDPIAEGRLAYLTGPRFDANSRTLTLTAERFPSRVENRRYLIHQLELLKKAALEPDEEFDQWHAQQS